MGGFTKEENIPYFLDYCKRVFSWFGPKIKLWATFNEPTVRGAQQRACQLLLICPSAVCSLRCTQRLATASSASAACSNQDMASCYPIHTCPHFSVACACLQCFSFVGFIAGLWCPGKVMQFGTAGQVLFNLLTAHVEVYKALKAMPGGDAACIGLVHQVRRG